MSRGQTIDLSNVIHSYLGSTVSTAIPVLDILLGQITGPAQGEEDDEVVWFDV